jgi:hypothetical protein
MLNIQCFALFLLVAPASGQMQLDDRSHRSEARPEVTSRGAVWPSGWRRTTQGWERSDDWTAPAAFAGDIAVAQGSIATAGRSLYDWIHLGKERERNWIQRGTVAVRAIHPALLGLMLVATAVLIARLSERAQVCAPSAPGPRHQA